MSRRPWIILAGLSLLLLVLTACGDENTTPGQGWANVCIDADGDGFGFQCENGSDCDDTKPTIHAGCGVCDKPNDGCACADDSAPVVCSLPPDLQGAGTLICREGMRYCRDSVWSACEGIRSYAALEPSTRTNVKYLGLISGDAGTCDDPCSPDCWRAQDKLEQTDAGAASNVVSKFGGGITLSGTLVDGGIVTSPDDLDPEPPCDPVTDGDCDGIPDHLDPDPSQKQFGSDKSTIFFDLAPGESKSSTFDIQFALKNADVYFLLDMSSSMGGETSKLITDLKSGNFLDDPDTFANEANIDCADRDFKNGPDNDLKAKGITGNIACLIRGAQFGVGFFREIPFSSTGAASTTGAILRYGWPNHEAFEHRQDMTESVPLTESALNILFPGYYNQNWAESSAIALHAVATGGPLYFGWDRPGIPRKVCAAGRFGYPCFRTEAMPIVVLITDAPMMSGPTPTSQTHLGDFFPNQSGKQPLEYNAGGLKHMLASTDPNYYPVSGNEKFESAYDVGAIDNTFKTYTGDTRGMTADVHSANLGMTTTSAWPTSGAASATTAAVPGYPDAVFRFKVTDSNKNLTVSTRGSRFKPTLAIVPAPAAFDVMAIGNNHSPATAKNLGTRAAPFNMVLTGDTSPAAFNVGDLPVASISEAFRGETDATSTDTAPDAWYQFTVAADTPAVTFAADGTGFDAVLGLYTSPPVTVASTSLLTNLNDKHTSQAAALIPGNANNPGTLDGRSVLYTGGNTSAATLAADYVNTLFSGAPVQNCGAVAGTAKDAVIDFRLSSARTVRLETVGSADVRDVPSFINALGLFTRPGNQNTAFSNALVCNVGAGTRRAFIEASLPAGTYSAVVRGVAATGTGSYGMLLSDAAVRPLATHNELRSASFTTSLKAGVTYYLVMRGRSTNNGNGRGAYSIKISTATGWMAWDNTPYATYADDPGCTGSYIPRAECTSSLGAAEIVGKFPVGEYYAVVKGRAGITAGAPGVTPPAADVGRGWYQITFGDATKSSEQTYVPPSWGVVGGNCTSGVCKSLVDNKLRVITIASTQACTNCGEGGSPDSNKALQEQGDSIAKLTGAKSLAGTPLRFDISNNGTGMGNKVVQAIYQLSQGLKQDISVRFVAAPDTPTAPQEFTFVSRAISTAGDGCDGIADKEPTGAPDAIPDTHTGCAPGAVPRFQITIGNPPISSPKRVLPNTATGAKGGYNMRIDLIGNAQYVIDSTPVFVVPEDVVYEPSKYTYSAQGVYSQDVGSAPCTGTARPRWGTLSWSASIPKDTSLEWRLCGGEDKATLDSCEAASKWREAAVVTTGTACTTSAECGSSGGYCAGNVCEYPRLAASGCAANADCGDNGVCTSGTCSWSKNPIDLRPIATTGLNGQAMVRVQVRLNASPDKLSAPTVYDYGLTYFCSPNL